MALERWSDVQGFEVLFHIYFITSVLPEPAPELGLGLSSGPLMGH